LAVLVSGVGVKEKDGINLASVVYSSVKSDKEFVERPGLSIMTLGADAATHFRYLDGVHFLAQEANRQAARPCNLRF
jgi:hypothetical protein